MNMFIRDIIESIKNTAGSNAKREILEANKSELLDLIFADTYDKSRNYFIKKYDKNWGENYLYGNILAIVSSTRAIALLPVVSLELRTSSISWNTL